MAQPFATVVFTGFYESNKLICSESVEKLFFWIN